MGLFLQVVPLSQRSGVLEWCSGTTPIGEFLVNVEDGAHKRYRPKDYSSYQCQKIMSVSQNNWGRGGKAGSFFTDDCCMEDLNTAESPRNLIIVF